MDYLLIGAVAALIITGLIVCITDLFLRGNQFTRKPKK